MRPSETCRRAEEEASHRDHRGVTEGTERKAKGQDSWEEEKTPTRKTGVWGTLALPKSYAWATRRAPQLGTKGATRLCVRKQAARAKGKVKTPTRKTGVWGTLHPS